MHCRMPHCSPIHSMWLKTSSAPSNAVPLTFSTPRKSGVTSWPLSNWFQKASSNACHSDHALWALRICLGRLQEDKTPGPEWTTRSCHSARSLCRLSPQLQEGGPHSWAQSSVRHVLLNERDRGICRLGEKPEDTFSKGYANISPATTE